MKPRPEGVEWKDPPPLARGGEAKVLGPVTRGCWFLTSLWFPVLAEVTDTLGATRGLLGMTGGAEGFTSLGKRPDNFVSFPLSLVLGLGWSGFPVRTAGRIPAGLELAPRGSTHCLVEEGFTPWVERTGCRTPLGVMEGVFFRIAGPDAPFPGCIGFWLRLTIARAPACAWGSLENLGGATR